MNMRTSLNLRFAEKEVGCTQRGTRAINEGHILAFLAYKEHAERREWVRTSEIVEYMGQTRANVLRYLNDLKRKKKIDGGWCFVGTVDLEFFSENTNGWATMLWQLA